MRKVLYVTGTRADFGLVASTLRRIHAHSALVLSIAVTGMHLLAECGMTVDEIDATGLPVCACIPTCVGERTPQAMARAIGEATAGLVDTFVRERPDIVLLLGDRGEMLAGAIAALHLGIPIAHLHGGERSGTVDEPVRHAISKMSHWHFVATAASRDRLVRMGEAPEHIHLTGAPGLDGLDALADRTRAETLDLLGLPEDVRYALALFHPVVQEAQHARAQTVALLRAATGVLGAQGIVPVWLDPNADAGSDAILQALEGATVRRITHLPRPAYVAALRHAEALLGNSSSGIIEASSLGTPVVNVGTRQQARERNANTFDCPADEDAIALALRQALAHGRFAPANRYGEGHAGEHIARLLAELPIVPALLDKTNCY